MNQMGNSPTVRDLIVPIKEMNNKLVNERVSVSEKCSEITA